MAEDIPRGNEQWAGWGAVCDGCGVKIIVDGDGIPVPNPDEGEWDSFPSCPVCGDTLHYDSLGETQWARETRLMYYARKAERERIVKLLIDRAEVARKAGNYFEGAAVLEASVAVNDSHKTEDRGIKPEENNG